MTADDPREIREVSERMRDAVTAAVRGSPWSPPQALLTDCVVVMGWNFTDGTYGTSVLATGAPWATRGLLEGALDREKEADAD